MTALCGADAGPFRRTNFRFNAGVPKPRWTSSGPRDQLAALLPSEERVLGPDRPGDPQPPGLMQRGKH
jgi:hypothetical protein